MLREQEMKALLMECLTPKRYAHSIGVCETACKLARRFGVSESKARLAGLLHDCAREYSDEELLLLAKNNCLQLSALERHAPVLLHAAIGAELARSKYQVDDEDVSQAIRLHTTGGAGMTDLDKIIYLADVIEPTRRFSGLEALRSEAEKNLEKAVLAAFTQSILFMVQRGGAIHPDTVIARNEILLKDTV